jgi:hypothetical protein
MTPDNQDRAVSIVNALQTRGGTKIYEAIREAMIVMKNKE